MTDKQLAEIIKCFTFAYSTACLAPCIFVDAGYADGSLFFCTFMCNHFVQIAIVKHDYCII
uniref:Uncharacterized protein n=1 Tax=Arundo donax TaxID=35708 RepID=A0A0A8ZUD4_ARUDO